MSRVYKSGEARIQSFDWAGEGVFLSADVQPLLRETPPDPEQGAEPQAEAETAIPDPPPVDLDHIRKQAFEEGFQAGKETTQQSCEQAYSERIARFGGIAEEAARFKQTLREAVEGEVVELAFAVARRILRRELQVDPETTLGVVKAGLERALSGEVQQIRVHPDDLEMVRAEVDGSVEVLADETVAAGGAVFETPEGRLDARIQTQLDEIERGLADR